jgi:hypothetical protein
MLSSKSLLPTIIFMLMVENLILHQKWITLPQLAWQMAKWSKPSFGDITLGEASCLNDGCGLCNSFSKSCKVCLKAWITSCSWGRPHAGGQSWRSSTSIWIPPHWTPSGNMWPMKQDKYDQWSGREWVTFCHMTIKTASLAWQANFNIIKLCITHLEKCNADTQKITVKSGEGVYFEQ